MSKEGNNEEVSQEGGGGGDGPKKDSGPDIYENRGTKKIVRLITVVAYVFSVSFVAIVLSAYYLFLWEPPNPRLLRRPVHLSSEPEVQFLLGDQPIVADESEKLGDISAQTFSSRAADVKGASDYERARYHREKLDESLFLLRNSAVEYLQNRANSTKSPDRDTPRKDWSISKSLNYTPFDEEETTNSTERGEEKNSKHSSKIMKRTFDSNGISLTLDSSTISGDEANEDRFTSSRNSSVPDSNFFHADSRLIPSLTKNRVVSREKYKKIIQANVKERRAMFDKKNMETEKVKYGKMHSTNEEYSNIFKSVMNDGPDFNATINGTEKYQLQQNNEVGNVKQVFDLKNESIVDSARNLELSNRIIYPQGSYESPGSLENVALTLKETETEQMTTKPMTEENEESLLPERLTTERQKDLLTILTEITDASTTTSSPLTKPNDLKIDISKETAEAFNRTNSKINSIN